MLTYTSSHWLTYLTSLESRRSRTKLSSLASRRMRSALPACRIWKLSLKSCGRGETEEIALFTFLSSAAVYCVFYKRRDDVQQIGSLHVQKREILKAQSHKSQFHCASAAKIKWFISSASAFMYFYLLRAQSAFRSERANKLHPLGHQINFTRHRVRAY